MLENISYIGKNGKTYSGSAALVHRIFSDDKQETINEKATREEELAEYHRLIRELGYAYSDE